MAYGDNRTLVASDTFDSSISGSWANGDGDYDTLSWATGGVVRPTNESNDSAIRRNSETFANDQYCKLTIGNMGAAQAWAGAAVRMKSGTDESAYIGYAQTSNKYFEIDEVDSSFNFSLLAFVSDTSNLPMSSGETLTMECEGTALRLGSDAAGSDVQKVSTTDATITSGNPAIELYRASGNAMDITAWEAGDIGAAAGTTVSVPVRTHSYSAQAPQVRAQVAAPARTHSYSAQAPGFVGTIAIPARAHSYSAQAPAVEASVAPGAAAHSYAGQAPGFGALIDVPASSHAYQGEAAGVEASVAPGAVSHSYAGQAADLQVGALAVPIVGHTYSGELPGVTAGAAIDVPVSSHAYAGQAPAAEASVAPGAAAHVYQAEAAGVEASVAPGAAVHTYAAQAPAAESALRPAPAVHTYATQAPALEASVAAPIAAHEYTAELGNAISGAGVFAGTASHAYQARAPQLQLEVAAPIAAHTYSARPVVVARLAFTEEPLRSRIGSSPAVDAHTRIGPSPAVDTHERIGPEVGVPGNTRIGDPAK